MTCLRDAIRKLCRGEVKENEPLARHTSLKVGGKADLFVTPADRADLTALLSALSPAGVNYLIIGGGFNLLIRDGGFRGVVISLKRLDRLEQMADGCISAEAGSGNLQLVRFAEQREMTGLEFLSGIPGTVGGAVAVNAGAHGAAVLDRVVNLTTICRGRTTVRGKQELDFGYRYTRLEQGEVIVEARFLLEHGDAREIGERIAAFLGHRRSAQAVAFPTAGSFFKNPSGTQAWRLIEEAGLRGTAVGGAQVAEAHANFLVNRGGATAADFLKLAAMIKEKVRERFGVELEEEVRIAGED